MIKAGQLQEILFLTFGLIFPCFSFLPQQCQCACQACKHQKNGQRNDVVLSRFLCPVLTRGSRPKSRDFRHILHGITMLAVDGLASRLRFRRILINCEVFFPFMTGCRESLPLCMSRIILANMICISVFCTSRLFSLCFSPIMVCRVNYKIGLRCLFTDGTQRMPLSRNCTGRRNVGYPFSRRMSFIDRNR